MPANWSFSPPWAFRKLDAEPFAGRSSVEARGAEDQEVYLTFSPRFERSWLESRKRLQSTFPRNRPISDCEANIRFACTVGPKKSISLKTKRISLEQLQKVLGLESVKDAEGDVTQEAPLPVWINFRQRALDVGIVEISKKTDLKIAIESLERSKHRRVTFVTFSISGASAATVTDLLKERSATPARLPDFVAPMKAKVVGSPC